MSDKKEYKFKSVRLVSEHLGSKLSRKFITILGEAINNSWDADADNVWITFIKKGNQWDLKIQDDGAGMSEADFQNKFLNFNHKKRGSENKKIKSNAGRPLIGSRGFGKLAFLSLSKKITFISKTKEMIEYFGAEHGLNEKNNQTSKEEKLKDYIFIKGVSSKKLKDYTKNLKSETIFYLENIKSDSMPNLEEIKKLCALNFRFSSNYKKFDIHIEKIPNQQNFSSPPISFKILEELLEHTQFLWIINNKKQNENDKEIKNLFKLKEEVQYIYLQIDNEIYKNVHGWIASVEKYNHKENADVGFFINGYMREKNIIKRISYNKEEEKFLYGELHFDELENQEKEECIDTAHEKILKNDTFENFLEIIRTKALKRILSDQRSFKNNLPKDDIDENQDDKQPSYILATRSFTNLEKRIPKIKTLSNYDHMKEKLIKEAKNNFSTYSNCYVSENILRKCFTATKFELKSFTCCAKDRYNKFKKSFKKNVVANKNTIFSTLEMNELACMAFQINMDPSYKEIRNAVAHTATVSEDSIKKMEKMEKEIFEKVLEHAGKFFFDKDKTWKCKRCIELEEVKYVESRGICSKCKEKKSPKQYKGSDYCLECRKKMKSQPFKQKKRS